jgi:5-methylcytosine-specific restriction endonuclease McrA
LNNDWIDIRKDPAHVKRERAKARELRNSDWWKRQLETGRCHYCGKKFEPSELTMDHILPVARGGKSTRGNCVPCCKTCNSEKKHLTPAEQIMRELDNESSPLGED